MGGVWGCRALLILCRGGVRALVWCCWRLLEGDRGVGRAFGRWISVGGE